ncbi:MAG: alpha/beta hydrolase [Gudongella sp.]|nr:alpha/beta hydrolase [Gudongella sp.]
MEGSYLNIKGGTKLYYRISGIGHPLVCIHGFGADSSAYRLTEKILSRKFMVVTMDLRGHGRTTTKDDNISFESMANDIEALLGYLELSEVSLLGWSMGGAVAMEYISIYGQERLRDLILVETSPKVVNDGDWKEGLFNGEYTIEMARADLSQIKNDFMGFATGFMKRMAPHMDSENQEILIKTMQDNNPDIMACVWENIISSDFRKTVGDIEVPCLVINGEESTFYSVESGQQLSETLKKGRHITIRGGHLAPIENPVEFNRAIERFLD